MSPDREEPAAVPEDDRPGEPSTEIVLRERPRPVPARRRVAYLAADLRDRLVELRRHPVAIASVSAATTAGGALLVGGLRRSLRVAAASQAAATPASPASAQPAIGIGYVLHEVHVVYHVVHHIRTASPRELPR